MKNSLNELPKTKQKETSRLDLLSSLSSIKIKLYKRSLEGDTAQEKLQWHSQQEEWKSLTLAGNTALPCCPVSILDWPYHKYLEVKNNLAKRSVPPPVIHKTLLE